MKLKLITFPLALLVASLSGCLKDESPLDAAYFQALGAEATNKYVSDCMGEKKALLDKHDAEGANSFAKSVRAANCLVAYKVTVAEDVKVLQSVLPNLKNAGSADEVDSMISAVSKPIEAKWLAVRNVFPEWRKDASPIGSTLFGLEQSATNAKSRISIRNLGKVG